MRFAEPDMLWQLAPVLPALILFLVWSWRRKQDLIRQFVKSRLLAHLTVGVSHARQKIRLVLLVVAVAALLLSLARPQYGFSWEQTRRRGLDIMVAMDTSRSMLAEDLKPSRLGRAKLAALDLMRLARSDRLGLVTFAGGAFVQCPLTLDEQAFQQNVDAVQVGIIPQGGSSLGEAIAAATDAFEKGADNHKVIVLLTDGEDHESGALTAAQRAARAGVKIFTIGVGTAAGEVIQIRGARGNSFLRDDEGNLVNSRLNENLLEKIAEASGGFYLSLQTTRAVETLYERGLAPLPKNEARSQFHRVYREQYYWFVLLAAGLLITELFLPSRRRPARFRAQPPSVPGPAVKIATLFLCLGLTEAGIASPSSALREFQAGKFPDALKEYERLRQKRTNDFRLDFNAGDAAYRTGEFEKAETYFNAAAATPDLKLQQPAYYNLGNTLYQTGAKANDLEKKKEHWEESIRDFQYALKLQPDDRDAQNNLQFVQGKLEELLKQQQQSNQQENKPSNKKESDPKKKEQQNQQPQEPKDPAESKSKPDQGQNPKEKPGEQKPAPKPQEQNSGRDEGAKPDETAEKKPSSTPSAGKKDEAPSVTGAQAGGAPRQMSEKEAEQFLEALRQEEKPLIFIPPEKLKARGRGFKDW